MQGFNLILLYDTTAEHILICKRAKDPYFGLYNLVGGKIEPGEDGLAAAYRELKEETGVTGEDTELLHMMDFTYYLQDCYVEVYVGRLKHPVTLVDEANPLFWSDLNHDFFSLKEYAGEGNIGHILEQAKIYCREIWYPFISP